MAISDGTCCNEYPVQSEEEKQAGDALIAQIRGVLEEHLDPIEVDRTGEYPKKVIEELAKVGVFGMKIGKEYGGLGLSVTNYARVLGFMASYCQSTVTWVSAHQSIGVPEPLKVFGTEEQKKKYLPRLASGEISAFALTEPDVGSDPAKMTTTATPSEDGEPLHHPRPQTVVHQRPGRKDHRGHGEDPRPKFAMTGKKSLRFRRLSWKPILRGFVWLTAAISWGCVGSPMASWSSTM